MKKYLKQFLMRGAMFAWGGPVVTAIVWGALHAAGTISTLTVHEAVLGIITTTVMAFIAAGISIVYQIENLPKAFAALIQMSVLYLDYLGFYLLNGWIPPQEIPKFTLIFAAVFAVIWGCIYIPIRIRVSRLNRMMNRK
jgi:hypothetical protein